MAIHDALRKDEKKFIEEHFNDMTIGEIALALGRSYEAVQQHTSRKNLHRFHRWTDEETAILLKLMSEGYMAEYIARKLKIDVNCVYNRIRRLRKNGTIQ